MNKIPSHRVECLSIPICYLVNSRPRGPQVYNRQGYTVTRSRCMTRFALLLVLAAGNVLAADQTVNIDTAAKIYQDAAVRDQVRASLVAMPKQIRDMFSRDDSTRLTHEQPAAVGAAGAPGLANDVVEAA